jgi:hypothetical protein
METLEAGDHPTVMEAERHRRNVSMTSLCWLISPRQFYFSPWLPLSFSIVLGLVICGSSDALQCGIPRNINHTFPTP